MPGSEDPPSYGQPGAPISRDTPFNRGFLWTLGALAALVLGLAVRDAASVLVKVPWVAHRVLLVARPMLSREDDAPGVRPGGTAVPPRLPPAPAARSGRPLVVEAVTGPPVRFY